MAEKDISNPGGFDILSNMLTGTTTGVSGSGDGNDAPLIDPEVLKAQLNSSDDDADDDNSDKDDKDDKDDSTDDDTDDVDKDDKDDADDSKDNTDDSKDDDSTDDADLGEFEADVTALLNEKFTEELGWDISDEDAPKNVKDFVELMKGVVAEASQPSYSNDEVKAFDEYVKQGGNLRSFYKNAVEGRVDTEVVDMENSFDQKRVLSEHLGNQGLKEERINKMLKRYEDAGVLDEEAGDALELLKDYNDKTKQKLLEDQKKSSDLAEQQQQMFVSTVEDSIKNLNDIRGVKIPEKEKKELLEYILVPDNEGYTKYQREYMGDIKNLLESAYFTKKGDVLINKSKAQGKSDAVKNLHDKLKANKGSRSNKAGNQSAGEISSGLSLLSSMIQSN